MEWVLLLIGIGYSIWSTYRKEARETEEKQRKAGTRLGPNDAADHIFAHRGQVSPSGRRTLGTMQPAGQPTPQQYRRDPNIVEEVTVEDTSSEAFTTRLNRRIMDNPAADIRRTIAEVFGDRYVPEPSRIESLRPEAERYTDYDELATYDDRTYRSASSEHQYASHFKLNEGLRKDNFRVGNTSAFDDDPDIYATKPDQRKAIQLDRRSLKSYFIMHEVLSKPRSVEALERRHHIARRDARHG